MSETPSLCSVSFNEKACLWICLPVNNNHFYLILIHVLPLYVSGQLWSHFSDTETESHLGGTLVDPIERRDIPYFRSSHHHHHHHYQLYSRL